MGDLPGPKIRISKSAGEGVDVPAGAMVVLERREPGASVEKRHDSYRFATTYPELVDDVEPGQRVLIADGSVRLLCTEKSGDSITCVVKQGGLIAAGKGINLPDTHLTLPVLTERDRRCVKWACENDVDFLALSFVRHAEDIRALRDLVQECGCIRQKTARGKHGDNPFVLRLPLLAKIEFPAAVKNIDAILDAADGIMVARGDLGL
jgi:pyruvate kinase